MTLSPQLAEVLDQIIESRLADLHTAFPATVVSYDRATQTAKLKPAVKQPVPTYDDPDTDRHETLPDLPQVPVVWPGGGSSFLACDLAVGDSVLVVCGQVDHSAWWRSARAGNAEDGIRHDISHAFCVPRVAARPQALQGLTGPLLQLSSSPTPTDALALASQLNRLIAVIKAWTPVTGDGGAALKAAVLAAFPAVAGSTTPTLATTTGSSRTKTDM